MPRSLRLAIVSPYPLLPLSAGGKIRIFHLARELGQLGVEVTILCPWKPGTDRPSLPNGGRVVRIPYPFLLQHLLTDRPFPYQFLVSWHPGYAALARAHLRHADIVQIEHASFADLVEALPPGMPVVYDAHNVEHDYVTSECRQPIVRDLVGRRIFGLEGALARRADHIAACSADDARRLAQFYGAPEDRISVVPNGIATTRADGASASEVFDRLPGLEAWRHRALFAGSDVEHNRQAVRFLRGTLAPQLAPIGGAIVIKGGCARPLGHELPTNVFLDPNDGDIGGVAAACTVALHPVVQGGGTNLKVLDYLAHGLPVVSTEFGFRGYPDLCRHAEIRPLSEFAEAVVRPTPTGPSLATDLEPYLWGSGARTLHEIYRHLTRPA